MNYQEEQALLDQARSMGFSIISPRRSGDSFQFRRGEWCVWRCIYDSERWMVAPLNQASVQDTNLSRGSLDEALILAMLSSEVDLEPAFDIEDEPILLSA